MKNHIFLVIFFSLSLLGCEQSLPEKQAAAKVLSAPISVALEDESGNLLGYGIPLRSGVLVAPDHLWQVSQSLYYKNFPIKILARDFRHDVLFFYA